MARSLQWNRNRTDGSQVYKSFDHVTADSLLREQRSKDNTGKTIDVRYATSCVRCTRSIPAGRPAWFRFKTRDFICPTCKGN